MVHNNWLRKDHQKKDSKLRKRSRTGTAVCCDSGDRKDNPALKTRCSHKCAPNQAFLVVPAMFPAALDKVEGIAADLVLVSCLRSEIDPAAGRAIELARRHCMLYSLEHSSLSLSRTCISRCDNVSPKGESMHFAVRQCIAKKVHSEAQSKDNPALKTSSSKSSHKSMPCQTKLTSPFRDQALDFE